MSCPRCLAEAALAQLQAMNRGESVSALVGMPGASVKLNGKPLDHSSQAGFGEAWLRMIAEGVCALCVRHGGPKRERRGPAR